MATFNTSHHESGGVILYNGELILLFCDNVHLSLPQTSQKETGRLYLTTHRMVFTNQSTKSSLKSFSAPFYTMHGLGLEQPIFGANYIYGKVKDANTNNSIDFKLKFYSGGAIEYGQALQSAARLTQNMAANNAFQPPPPYTPSASQYYQAPPTVYQPAYNVGFVLPTDVFNQAPPAGFVYTSEAPPPYPGLGPQQQPPQGAPGGYPPPPTSNYPPAGPTGYPPTSQPGYPPVSQPSGPGFNVGGPGVGYPSGPGGYPAGPGYPPSTGAPVIGFAQPGGYAPQSSQPTFYPGNAPPSYQQSGPPGYPPNGQPGYPSGQPGYPPAQPGYPPSQPGYPPTQPGYPSTQPGYPPMHNEFYSNASAPMEEKK